MAATDGSTENPAVEFQEKCTGKLWKLETTSLGNVGSVPVRVLWFRTLRAQGMKVTETSLLRNRLMTKYKFAIRLSWILSSSRRILSYWPARRLGPSFVSKMAPKTMEQIERCNKSSISCCFTPTINQLSESTLIIDRFILVKAVEGLLSFQIQSTIDRSTDFAWLCWNASATAVLIYTRNLKEHTILLSRERVNKRTKRMTEQFTLSLVLISFILAILLGKLLLTNPP